MTTHSQATCALVLFLVACGSTGQPERENGASAEAQATEHAATGDADCNGTSEADAGKGAPATGDTAGSAPSCPAPKHVSSAEEFAGEVARLAWQDVSISGAGALSIGHDLVADVDLTLDASSLVAPADCPVSATDAGSSAKCHAPLFRDYAFPSWGAESPIPGIACSVTGEKPVRKGATCAQITIRKGTTFRLRAVVEDMHPSTPSYWPFIEFARECAAPCAEGEARCERSQTCFPTGYESCAYCDGDEAASCACRGEDGVKAEGAECTFASSPDVEVVGTCSAGTCTTAK